MVSETKMKKQSAQLQKTSSAATYWLAGVALALVVAVVSYIIWKGKDEGTGGAEVAILTSKAAVAVGLPDAPQNIDVFEDFLCPYCGQLERNSGDLIQKSVDGGSLRVRYHFLTFLDKQSKSGDYSTRAAAAALCVAEASSAAFPKFHASLFKDQPKEGGNDFSDEVLTQKAVAVGAPESVRFCIASKKMFAQVAKNNAAAEEILGGIVGKNNISTPTVLAGGKLISKIGTTDDKWLRDLLPKP